jgi:imidazoleglycerol phosphate dehydratase HisB
LYKLIKHHPFDKGAVHDIHLKFNVVGLWSILSKSTVGTANSVESTNGGIINSVNMNSNAKENSKSLCILETDPYSKDIRLERRVINDLDIQVTVHHTDTVTVIIGCSFAPIITDETGVIRLSDALATIEEELSQLIARCDDNGNHVNNSVGGVSYSKVDVPNHMCWIVTRWDFGVDGLITYTGPQFFFSWGSSQNVLIIIYIKEWPEGDHRIRVEIQEFPDKSLGKALREKLNPRKGS